MRVVILFIFLFVCFSLKAQNTFRPNLYYNHMNFYNPAAGWADSSKGNVQVYLQHKWENSDVFEKKPNLFASYLNSSEDLKHRYSAGYLYDGYSFYTRNLLYLGYGYSITLPRNGKLTFGARTNLFFDYINQSKIQQPVEDEITAMHFTPDLDLGLYFTLKRMRLSFSGKNLFGNQVKVDGFPVIINHREMNFLIGGDVKFLKHFLVSPFTMIRHERSFRIDGGISLSYKNRIELAYLMRVFEARNILSLRTEITSKITIGISADFSLVSSDINTDLQLLYKF